MVELFNKYKSMIMYLVFGVATTIVNVVVYSFCSGLLKISTTGSTCIAWLIAVLFAYVTNRKWVFESGASTAGMIVKEVVSFFSCRLATGAVDLIIMYVCVDRIGWNGIMIKALANVLVIILNYIASKLLVFKGNSAKEG